MPNTPRRRGASPKPGGRHRSADLDQPTTIVATCGAMLCAVRYWTEAEWAGLPESDRPRDAAHKPGVGWVGAVPVAGLN